MNHLMLKGNYLCLSGDVRIGGGGLLGELPYSEAYVTILSEYIRDIIKTFPL